MYTTASLFDLKFAPYVSWLIFIKVNVELVFINTFIVDISTEEKANKEINPCSYKREKVQIKSKIEEKLGYMNLT